MSERIAKLVRERKGLNANVDFYSATVYYSIGIPTRLFTAIFSIARCSGWVAQVLEQVLIRKGAGYYFRRLSCKCLPLLRNVCLLPWAFPSFSPFRLAGEMIPVVLAVSLWAAGFRRFYISG